MEQCLPVSANIHPPAIDGPAFAAKFDKVLVPEREPGTTAVLPTLATQFNKDAEAALRAHGCRYRCLQPYSPDLNLIEQAFSQLKAHLRRVAPQDRGEVLLRALQRNRRSL